MPNTAIAPMDARKLGYSVAETCASLGITRPTMYRLLADGRLRSIKIGRRRIITADSLTELFAGAVTS